MFRFKQFTVVQDHAAMKVCTDACLLGALVKTGDAKKMLDIGTGTGLLSLMISQKKSDLAIDAIEIDADACIDAKKNFLDSPFSKQINLYNDSIQEFAQKTSKTYDLIVSNPPFFQDHLPSTKPQRNLALHSQTLTQKQLLEAVKKLLDVRGTFWVLLPPYPMQQLIELALKKQLNIIECYDIKHKASKPIFRQIACFSYQKPTEIYQETIHIYENEIYSNRFAQLLKDYYLIF